MKIRIKTIKLISLLLFILILSDRAVAFAYMGSMGYEGGISAANF